ncbi:T9SS type A sorting domain-containing protein [Cyclobacterium sp.]|uniref:T9SS type A sorting domain-containing protein n=1 Tax=Cyclobacterium sp. TaxID=1966343 RepID=UPI0019C2073E|nr:T9SS type A sorting domain-containing protein [Cyclobacterium sp.]MBD3629345.1 T9SS type A sorting domain-containing protein [Cyclobacterium sp.]
MLLFICLEVSAQLNVTGPLLVCPGTPLEYGTDLSASGSCTYTWTVTNGVFAANGLTEISGPMSITNTVDVIWNNVAASNNDTAPKGKLTVTRSNCYPNVSGDPVSDDLQNILIKTLNNVTPGSITGPTSVNLGVATNINYSIARVLFPNTYPKIYADSYQWVIPAGWKIGTITSDGSTPIGSQSHSVAVTPNSCGGAGQKVKVRAYSNCASGYVSNWREITVARPTPVISFTQAPPTSVVCNVPTPITVSVASIPGASSYTWTKPGTWTGTSVTNTITLTPDGFSAGQITVKANICGTQTTTLSETITLSLFSVDTPPSVSGANLLCATNSSYTLSNLPPGATATWAVSPSALFGGTKTGSGTNASIRAFNNTSTSGQGKITFTVQTSCGSFQVEKPMWVGVPKQNDTSIQPNSYPLCTNQAIYFNAYYNKTDPGNSESDIINYEWIPPTTGCYTVGGKNQVMICNFSQDGYYDMRVRAQNACGVSGWFWFYPFVENCYYYAVNINPNPAEDFINVEMVQTPTSQNDEGQKDGLNPMESRNSEFSFNKLDYEIKIYDQEGYLKVSHKSEKENLNIDISSLAPGRYYVHIEHPDGVIKRQILVK